ncbi:protease modulator HflK [Erythrobacter litoralis]|uniref:Probable integral membrane proteinase n=1 Tax=Erythrobacter litoralis (strain HTCC2594) TaxID=314225 RepID=Q2N7I3_ERYLH|nr:protease modulator HflK [Erythrobacter litoralis]ABC64358.1 probable integral membrane proteinase [Erythrobacter litoralis HTCC2594]
MAGKSPWGSGGGKGSNDEGSGGDDSTSGDVPSSEGSKGPRNPWLPPGKDRGEPRRSASIEDIFKNRGPEGPRRTGGGGKGPNFRLPERPGGKSWFPLALGGLAAVWILTTSVHQVAPAEQALVSWIGGKYSRTMDSGFQVTLPYPIQSVDKENVQEIRSEKIPAGDTQKLILTGDQNLVDLSYLIRWNIGDLALFRYRLADPIETVREAAETAMRQSVAELELDTVLSGEGRAEIEQNVRERMQAILDAYQAGIVVQGIEIDKTDPPETVVDAFKDVSAAEQDAQAELNRARRYAQQLLARAQGDAAAFDKIYAEYRLAPDVTRRRLYYETMESVLRETDKTVIEADGVTPYLPLPEVQRRNRASQAEGQ